MRRLGRASISDSAPCAHSYARPGRRWEEINLRAAVRRRISAVDHEVGHGEPRIYLVVSHYGARAPSPAMAPTVISRAREPRGAGRPRPGRAGDARRRRRPDGPPLQTSVDATQDARQHPDSAGQKPARPRDRDTRPGKDRGHRSRRSELRDQGHRHEYGSAPQLAAFANSHPQDDRGLVQRKHPSQCGSALRIRCAAHEAIARSSGPGKPAARGVSSAGTKDSTMALNRYR